MRRQNLVPAHAPMPASSIGKISHHAALGGGLTRHNAATHALSPRCAWCVRARQYATCSGRKPEDIVADLEETDDYLMAAHHLCAILGLKTTSGNAVEVICKHKGNFTLPAHLRILLGRTRQFEIQSGSSQQMLRSLNKLLL
eukprot:576449-Pleurochrysis_carterae.AAC.1